MWAEEVVLHNHFSKHIVSFTDFLALSRNWKLSPSFEVVVVETGEGNFTVFKEVINFRSMTSGMFLSVFSNYGMYEQ